MNIEEKIRGVIGDPYKYIFALGDIKGLLDERYSGFNYALSIARKYDDEIIDEGLEEDEGEGKKS